MLSSVVTLEVGSDVVDVDSGSVVEPNVVAVLPVPTLDEEVVVKLAVTIVVLPLVPLPPSSSATAVGGSEKQPANKEIKPTSQSTPRRFTAQL